MEVMGLEVLSLIRAQVFPLAGGAGHTWLIQPSLVGLGGEGMGISLSCCFYRPTAEAETPILWPPDVKNRLIGKDHDARKD